MKYFEFSTLNFDYYALIGAKTTEEAIGLYDNEVEDIYRDDGSPNEITEEDVIKTLHEMDGTEAEKAEAMEDFEIGRQGSEPFLIIVDWELC